MHKAAVEELEKLLFTTSKPDEKLHRHVIVFDNKHAITYQHGFHSSFKKDQKVTLYSVLQAKVEIEVCF